MDRGRWRWHNLIEVVQEGEIHNVLRFHVQEMSLVVGTMRGGEHC